jgi:CSLREA domain-containing protein
VSALFFGAAQFLPTQAVGAFTVNSLADTPDAAPGNGICADAGGACTLRAALNEADSLLGEETINFSVTGTINLTGPLPFISSVFINGPGSGLLTVRRDTGGDYRIFTVGLVFSSISGLTISNGRTPDSVGDATAPSGGGILHTSGLLRLTDIVITGNATGNGGNSVTSFGGWGGFGGGIFSSGTLEMTDCVISNNTTGNGGNGTQFGGSGGRGAGIYFAPGTLTMKNVTITNNNTGSGGGPTSANSGYGAGMWLGGDFFPTQNTTANLTNVTVTNNNTANNTNFNGDTGGGAGIYIHQGIVTLTDSNVSNNHTGNVNLASSAAASGRGGGINNNGILTVVNSLISGNTTGNSASGSNSTGGGITNGGTLTVINSTVSGNSTGIGPSMGGGIYSFTPMKLVNCTITGNFTPDDLGNGVSGNGTTITVANTIIAGNGNSANDPDLNNPLFSTPSFVSQGHNLIGNVDGFAPSFNATGDQTGTGAAPLNPQLGALANNGGPTFTHALLSNSPALDAGDNALAKDANNNTLLTDQRGAQRIADSGDPDSTATVDIGAFESLQTLEDITNKTTIEDVPLTVTFGLGDAGPGVTSVTATSNNQAVVPDGNLVVSGTGNVRSLLITPTADQSGLATITVTVNLSGGGSLIDTFGLTVLPVNDMPTFTKGPNQTINEDAGPQTVNNWATGVSAGPNEGSQTLTFIVTNTSPSTDDLFSVAPAISASGTLTYTPAANRSGSATFTVVLKDDGGTANGGQDTTVPQQIFTITINEVNDPPSFTKGPDQTVAEDPGFQSIGPWATNLSAGPNESQSLQFAMTNNTNPALFSIPPFVNSAGFLSYMPAANASGFADISIVLADGIDTTASQTFRITVTPVNDAPVNGVPFFPITIQNTPLVFSAATFNAITVSDVDAGTDVIRVTLTGTHGTVSLPSTTGLTFVTGDGTDDVTMSFNGTLATINARLNGLTFKPETGFATGQEVASLQIISDDQGHNGDGGAKSTTTTFNIFVLSGGQLAFNTPTYGVNENGGTATITVLRGAGSAGTATVNYAISNGTATSGGACTSGVDYLPASGTLTWANNDSSSKTFTITICNDGVNEENETINLTLSDAGGTAKLGSPATATLTIGNDDAAVLLTEELTEHAIALDLVFLTRDPFSLTNPFNLGTDQRRRISLFVWRLGLLPGDTVANVGVVARDDEGRTYDLPVEALNPTLAVPDVTQVVVRLPDNVIGAPRDLRVKVTLRGLSTNEGFIKIAAP